MEVLAEVLGQKTQYFGYRIMQRDLRSDSLTMSGHSFRIAAVALTLYQEQRYRSRTLPII